MAAMKNLRLHVSPRAAASVQLSEVDLDQIASRATVVVSDVSFREILHEPGP
jgi:hypothetical protein